MNITFETPFAPIELYSTPVEELPLKPVPFPVNLIQGLEDWIAANKEMLQTLFTPEWKAEYETLEDFACDIFAGDLEVV